MAPAPGTPARAGAGNDRLRAEQAQASQISDLEKQLNFVQSEHQRSQGELEEQRSQRRELEEESPRGAGSNPKTSAEPAHGAERTRSGHAWLDSLRSKHDLQARQQKRQQREQARWGSTVAIVGFKDSLTVHAAPSRAVKVRLASSREQAQVARDELGQARAENESLGRRVEELESKLAEVSHQRSDLNERLSQSEKATTVAQTQADEQRQSVADLRKKVAAEEARSEGLDERLRAAHERIQALEVDAERARQLDQGLQRQGAMPRRSRRGSVALQVALAARQQAMSEVEHQAEEGQQRVAEAPMTSSVAMSRRSRPTRSKRLPQQPPQHRRGSASPTLGDGAIPGGPRSA